MSESLQDDRFVEVLFHEYGALRKEILARTLVGVQILGVAAVVAVWLLSNFVTIFTAEHFPLGHFLFAFAATCFSIAFVYWLFGLNNYEIKKAAGRVREIEGEINFYHRRTLLRWETYAATAMTGFWKRNPRKRYAKGDEPPQWTPPEPNV